MLQERSLCAKALMPIAAKTFRAQGALLRTGLRARQMNQMRELSDGISQPGASAVKMSNFQHGCFP
jgi:hypothetical protein